MPNRSLENEHYVRLSLCELQHHAESERQTARHFFFSNTKFLYGDKSATVPAFLDTFGLSAGGTETRLTINRPLTPLFPYRGDVLNLTGGLMRLEGEAEITFSRTLEQLSTLLSTPAFSRMPNVSEIVWNSILSEMMGLAARRDLLFFRMLGGKADPLIPGYFAVLRMPKSPPPGMLDLTSRDFLNNEVRVGSASGLPSTLDPTSLCVVNGKLCVGSANGLPNESQSVPEDLEYLLLRTERLSTRGDWADLDRVGDSLVRLEETTRQDDFALLRDALNLAAREVLRSHDFTEADKKRVIRALTEHVRVFEDRRVTGYSAVAAETKLALTADLKQAEELHRSAERAAATPFQEEASDRVLVVDYRPASPVRVDVDGFRVLEGEANLTFDISSLARQADEAFSGDWRFKAKQLRESLSDKLFKDRVVWTAADAVGISERHVHMRFRGSLDFLRVPFEFLPDHSKRDYLVLKYPLARTVIGNDLPPSKRPGLSRSSFNELHRRQERLSILLIASNTPPEVSRVDAEVEALSASLPGLFRIKEIEVQMKVLASRDATYDTVINELKGAKYHIIHYAGHGVFDNDSPEESYLPLRSSCERSSIVKQLRVSTIKRALEESKVQLVYLSCCVGAAQGEPFKLQDDDYLGIIDGLLQAGVPSIIGFRWPVLDSGSEKLAIAFYKYLAQEGQPDTALLLARREISEEPEDRSWLSPILILQA